MRIELAIACLLAASGCAGDLSGRSDGSGARDASVALDATDDGPASDASGGLDAAPALSLAIAAPADGATFVRDAIIDGEWAADIGFLIDASGIDHVDLVADDTFELGSVIAPGWALTYAFHGDGARVITAIGRDASGAELARDEITITITPPADESCHAMLDALGLDWAPVASLMGVADPVRVQPLIGGVRYRYVSNAEPTPMVMDCELAPRLARLSAIVRPFGIDEVIHIGIYNYRCIGGGDPASGTCTPSQHAYARAIDLHAFGLEGSDVEYSTETDFAITMRADACPIPSSSEPDRVLKDIACALWAERVFQIVLTPNYNDAHRNHYHVDLTEGSMYLGESIAGVDPIVPGLGD